MAMSLQILLPDTARGMARRAPNPTKSFCEFFWIIKFSFLSANSQLRQILTRKTDRQSQFVS